MCSGPKAGTQPIWAFQPSSKPPAYISFPHPSTLPRDLFVVIFSSLNHTGSAHLETGLKKNRFFLVLAARETSNEANLSVMLFPVGSAERLWNILQPSSMTFSRAWKQINDGGERGKNTFIIFGFLLPLAWAVMEGFLSSNKVENHTCRFIKCSQFTICNNYRHLEWEGVKGSLLYFLCASH